MNVASQNEDSLWSSVWTFGRWNSSPPEHTQTRTFPLHAHSDTQVEAKPTHSKVSRLERE